MSERRSSEIDLQPPITLRMLEPGRTGSLSSSASGRVALLVCHGMGQQVRFETLMDVARVIERTTALTIVGDVVARLVRFGSHDPARDLQRAEFTLEDPQGRRREVHVYEAYWAPLTEGRVGMRDVIAFLAGAAFRGWIHLEKRPADTNASPAGATPGHAREEAGFHRWMFGRSIWLPIRKTTTRRRLWCALAVVLSLVVINTLISVIAAARLIRGTHGGWPSDGTLLLFANELVVLVALIGVAGFAVWRIQRRRAQDPSRPTPGAMITLTWLLVWSALIATIAIAAALLVELVWTPPFVDISLRLTRAGMVGLVVVWLALVALSAAVRWLFIEYVGDVAAYISSNSADKFREVREAIQQLAYRVAQAIYGALHETDGTLEYGRVVVVGHSLGSVVAYDTLNAVLREDTITGGLSAVERTRMLLTFGSPLNKTAFIFRTQMPPGSELREVLAASVQPMIQSYALRPAQWINLYSSADWIGGPLEYDDDAADRSGAPALRKVQNVLDTEATTPLAAHSEHWNTPELGRRLAEAIFS